jgi:hypothetical protein
LVMKMTPSTANSIKAVLGRIYASFTSVPDRY